MPREKLLKGKKKHWCQILAPRIFNNAVLGESRVSNSELLIGKKIKINLMNLTRDPKKSNVNLSFIVESIKEGKGITRIVGYEIVPATIKRLVKKGRNKIELSFLCSTSDNKTVRIKPFAVTRGMAKGAVLASLRKGIISELTKFVNRVTFEELLNQIIFHKLQMGLKKQLKKVYPIRNFEIKSLKIEGKKKAPVKEKPKEEKKQEVPKEEIKIQEPAEAEVKEPAEKVEETKMPEAEKALELAKEIVKEEKPEEKPKEEEKE